MAITRNSGGVGSIGGRAAAPVVARIVLVIGGGYGATALLVAGLSMSLTLVGIFRSEAVVLASLLGFPVYLTLIVWGFAAKRLTQVFAGLVLAAGFGGLLMCVGWLGGGWHG